MKTTRILLALPLLALVALLPLRAEDPPAKALAPVLQPFVESHSLAGAVVLVADKNRILDLEAVGFADVAAKKAMTTDSLFWIASMSKPITAVGLMMLVDEGKVKLDDPVSKYLPEFKDQMLAGKEKGSDLQKPTMTMTVRHLLTHTSGMSFSVAKENPTLDGLTLREGAEAYAKNPLNSEPGAKFVYSNAGINTAGRIIEVVSGTPYQEFLEKRLFTPLGMKDTTFVLTEEQASRLAKGYKPSADKKDLEETKISQLKYPLTDKNRQPMPAGGLFSTASDVGKFCQMVLNGGTFNGKRYLSEAAVQEMTKRQTPETMQQNWGLGFARNGDGSYGHGGAWATNMNIDPKRGLVTVWMIQASGGFPNDGGKAQGAFRKAADDKFGSTK
jgi:CubicO group peptidase (beta-lactamase class C family)